MYLQPSQELSRRLDTYPKLLWPGKVPSIVRYDRLASTRDGNLEDQIVPRVLQNGAPQIVNPEPTRACRQIVENLVNDSVRKAYPNARALHGRLVLEEQGDRKTVLECAGANQSE